MTCGSFDSATHGLQVRLWSETEFANGQAAWERLLSNSTADPLFLSWDWQFRWWKHHARLLNAKLQLVAVSQGDRLLGLAPFYLHDVIVRQMFRMRRLELIGIAWRYPQAVYSDYLDLIVATSNRPEVIAAIAHWLSSDRTWDELALGCVRRGSDLSRLVEECGASLGYRRDVNRTYGRRVQLGSGFSEFLARLDGDVRRRVYHQRRKLLSAQIQQAQPAESAEFLEILTRYMAVRWGDDARRDALHQAFHLDLTAALAQRGELRLSRLRSGGKTLSVLYAIRKRDTVYYIQSAFSPETARGISPGYLHFGYVIEDACRESVTVFDFLPGRGRQRDYKRDFPAEPIEIVDYHIVRARLASGVYALYDLFAIGSAKVAHALRIFAGKVTVAIATKLARLCLK